MSDTQIEAKATAPYTSFSSLKTLLKNLKEHGIPARIDRSVLGGSFSNAVGSQLLTAMKFLSLTDGNNQPTELLKPLVDELGTEEWKSSLHIVLERAYAPLFNMDLEKASAAQFNERFRSAYLGTDDVQRKSMAFFLAAARDAGAKVSPYIMKNKKPRAASTTKRTPKTKKNNVSVTKNDAGNDDSLAQHQTKAKPSEILLMLFDPAMKQPEQDAIWTLIKFFKTKGT